MKCVNLVICLCEQCVDDCSVHYWLDIIFHVNTILKKQFPFHRLNFTQKNITRVLSVYSDTDNVETTPEESNIHNMTPWIACAGFCGFC